MSIGRVWDGARARKPRSFALTPEHPDEIGHELWRTIGADAVALDAVSAETIARDLVRA